MASSAFSSPHENQQQLLGSGFSSNSSAWLLATSNWSSLSGDVHAGTDTVSSDAVPAARAARSSRSFSKSAYLRALCVGLHGLKVSDVVKDLFNSEFKKN